MRIGKPRFVGTSAPDYLKFVDEKTAGTDGGDFFSAAWRTRTLTAEKADTGNFGSLASNQITLAAGTYRCLIRAPGVACDQHKARLRNITDGTTVTDCVGSNCFGTGDSIIAARFVLAGTKVLEVQHRCATDKTVNGLGVAANFGEVEVYTVAEFWREAI